MLIPEVSFFSVVMHDEVRITDIYVRLAIQQKTWNSQRITAAVTDSVLKTRHIVSSVPTIQHQKEGQDVSLKRFFLLCDFTRSLYVRIKSLLRALC